MQCVLLSTVMWYICLATNFSVEIIVLNLEIKCLSSILPCFSSLFCSTAFPSDFSFSRPMPSRIGGWEHLLSSFLSLFLTSCQVRTPSKIPWRCDLAPQFYIYIFFHLILLPPLLLLLLTSYLFTYSARPDRV